MSNHTPHAETIQPLSGSVEVMYRIYMEIAVRDHRCRVQALYGDQAPPTGHTPYRPLPLHHFADRFESACAIAGGEVQFRKQLARMAKVYGVDCVAAVATRLAA